MIAVEGLDFGYRRRQLIIQDLTHAFTPGALTAVTGASGRGKSTLLYLVGLMLTPVAGHVRIAGEDVGRRTDRQRSAIRAERMGFVFQDALLDPSRTVLDNVLEGALYTAADFAPARERARGLLERAGVAARHDHRPGEISGGQAQRVALCRALVGEPAVVLADEPTGNLDVASADAAWGMLRDCAVRGATVIVASHDPLRIADCDERVEL